MLQHADRDSLGLGPLDDLSVSFDLVISSSPARPLLPTSLTLDLDLDVFGGAGDTAFFESFEESLGAFEIENLDQWLHTNAAADGYRCQYNDPDWPNSGSSPEHCHPGVTPGHADAVFWGLSGPNFSPLGGRGFSGFHSLFFGIDLGPDLNWTTPAGMLEAVRTSEPINLGWDDVSPSLQLLQQVSLLDARALNIPESRSVDRGVVMAQVADEQDDPAGEWIKLYPFENSYDTQPYHNDYECMFDPVDDGSNEDDFFDPSDPLRRYGPSSTCYPEYAYSNIGETSEPFGADNVGNADGPGRQGLWGMGTWIETGFDLSRFRGKRIRLRFLATALELYPFEDWEEAFAPDFNPDARDDGWWIDDVTVDGVLTSAATVAIDSKNNSSLPDPSGDGDRDGVFDVCDNCLSAVNPNQPDVDGDGDGDACDPCPVHPFVLDHDSDGLCAEQDNCPFDTNADQANGDNDPAGTACDCNDLDPSTYPGADEINDARDNNCPGDLGYGAVDETSSQSGFHNVSDKNEYSWPEQIGAARYEVVRGNTADFFIGCAMFGPIWHPFLVDDSPVASEEIRYYMNRAILPNLGSWGNDSAGLKRTVPCSAQ